METKIRYISENPLIQEKIINSGIEEVIDATYYLLMHEKCSIEYYLKYLFRKGFESTGQYVFRNSSPGLNIFMDFINRRGGNFNELIQELSLLAFNTNAVKFGMIIKDSESIVKMTTTKIDELPRFKFSKTDDNTLSKFINLIFNIISSRGADILFIVYNIEQLKQFIIQF